MADSYITVTSQDFTEKVLNAPQMVIVDFSTDKISSCQIFDPEFEAISQEFQGRVLFAKVNVDENQELTRQWNVDAVPTSIFFNRGQEIYRIKGIVMRNRLRKQVEGVLLVI